jgi:hypothetical protein
MAASLQRKLLLYLLYNNFSAFDSGLNTHVLLLLFIPFYSFVLFYSTTCGHTFQVRFNPQLWRSNALEPNSTSHRHTNLFPSRRPLHCEFTNTIQPSKLQTSVTGINVFFALYRHEFL